MTHTAKAVITQQAAAIEGLIPQLTTDFDQVVSWVHNSNGRVSRYWYWKKCHYWNEN